jgi:hypothetical protein
MDSEGVVECLVGSSALYPASVSSSSSIKAVASIEAASEDVGDTTFLLHLFVTFNVLFDRDLALDFPNGEAGRGSVASTTSGSGFRADCSPARSGRTGLH